MSVVDTTRDKVEGPKDRLTFYEGGIRRGFMHLISSFYCRWVYLYDLH